MSTLYVRDFPEELHDKVKMLASRNQRSISAEVVILIEQALNQEAIREQRSVAIDRIAERRRSYTVPRNSVDSLTMLREDRDR